MKRLMPVAAGDLFLPNLMPHTWALGSAKIPALFLLRREQDLIDESFSTR